jgi:hypothetical protein
MIPSNAKALWGVLAPRGGPLFDGLNEPQFTERSIYRLAPSFRALAPRITHRILEGMGLAALQRLDEGARLCKVLLVA